jgi:hypothetical protein
MPIIGLLVSDQEPCGAGSEPGFFLARTIDIGQNQIPDRAVPVIDLVDKILGPVDEILISRLITSRRQKAGGGS